MSKLNLVRFISHEDGGLKPGRILLLSIGLLLFGSLVTTFNVDTLRMEYSLHSYRIPQYAVSYTDLGFVKRGLAGTILVLSNFNFTLLNLMGLGYAFLGMLCLSATLFFKHIISGTPTSTTRNFLVLCAVLSPATFMHFGSDILRLDVITMSLLFIAVLFVLRNKVFMAGLLAALALLVHEAYLLWAIPTLVACVLLQTNRDTPHQLTFQPAPLAKLLAPPALIMILILAFGAPQKDFVQIQNAVFSHCPPTIIIHPQSDTPFISPLRVWDSSLPDNLRHTLKNYTKPKTLVQLPALILVLSIYLRFFSLIVRPCILFIGLAPTSLLFILGIDFYRWLALIITNGFILSFTSLYLRPEKTPLPNIGQPYRIILPALTLLGPLGVTTLSPFIIRIGKLFNLPL